MEEQEKRIIGEQGKIILKFKHKKRNRITKELEEKNKIIK